MNSIIVVLRLHKQDRIVEETAAKRNELESYVYEIRGKLDDEFHEYIRQDLRDDFQQKLNQVPLLITHKTS